MCCGGAPTRKGGKDSKGLTGYVCIEDSVISTHLPLDGPPPLSDAVGSEIAATSEALMCAKGREAFGPPPALWAQMGRAVMVCTQVKP